MSLVKFIWGAEFPKIKSRCQWQQARLVWTALIRAIVSLIL
jgi:hypothetical protein